jgi:hypothetical protein
MKDGKPVLDTSIFADKLKPEEKHQSLSKESELYKAVQNLLDDYFKPT